MPFCTSKSIFLGVLGTIPGSHMLGKRFITASQDQLQECRFEKRVCQVCISEAVCSS